MKRILFYGPSLHVTLAEVDFVNSHSSDPLLNPNNPPEFQPVDASDPENAPGKSQVWGEQKWVSASVADFQQFDAIVFSDQGTDSPNWASALASRAIWGSAINGNIFITSGDPVEDGVMRVLRQGLRFAAAQTGNGHGRTGLYVALDHTVWGEDAAGMVYPTEIELLSWFGSFRAVPLSPCKGDVLDSNPPGAFGPCSGNRLVAQNPFLNVLGSDVSAYSGSVGQGFHSWPTGFYPVAQRVFDVNPTPTSAPGYLVPCEADTGYKSCSGLRPLVYMLAKVPSANDLTTLVSAQCNIARPATVGQSVTFSAYSMFAGQTDTYGVGPNTQISWRVVSGPNGPNGPNPGLHGKCQRQLNQNYIPTSIWNGAYTCNVANVTANNFQDVVQFFLDYDGDEALDDMTNNNNCPTDCDDPAPGAIIEFGTTYTVNWGLPQITLTKLASPAAALEPPSGGVPGTPAFFRVTRTGAWANPIVVSACVRENPSSAVGLATPSVDYEIKTNGITQDISTGLFTITIPAGSSSTSADVEVSPLHDTEAEGVEIVRIALKDAPDGSYFVGGLGASGNGFAELTINDNDQPVVTVTAPTTAFENAPQSPGAWVISAASLSAPLNVFLKLSGTATHEVDYLTDATISEFGTVIVTLDPAAGGHATLHLIPFQDSRTEGTEYATLSLSTHPSYKNGSPASASVNVIDDDSPKIPANGYTITDLGDAGHGSTFAAGINNTTTPQIAGSFNPTSWPVGTYHAFRYSGGVFTDVPVSSIYDYMTANAINDNGLMIGNGYDAGLTAFYHWVWDGTTTTRLQTPTLNVDLNYGPRALNDANWIVGSAKNQAGVYRATRWDSGGNFAFLGGLSGNQNFSSFVWALSSSIDGHRAIGESQFDLQSINATTTALHAFRTQSSGSPAIIAADTDDLGNALVSETSSSGAYAINNLFEIAGFSANSATERRAAYKDGNSAKHKGWRILGVLPGGSGTGLSSQALGMNAVGLIAGWSRTTTTGNGNPKAVVWENYQAPAATDLNLKIPVADRPNWLLQYATGINASGQIVGYGLSNGAQRAFLLTPLP